MLGPPGAGKGTQAALVSAAHQVPAISTGDIFRANIKNETPLGLQVKEITASGGYVPDEITNEIVKNRLAEADAVAGFLLDGYPRTTGQVEALDAMLAEAGHQLDAVVELTVDTDEVVSRLLARAVEQGREDDTEEVIRARMRLYAEETAPLAAVYKERGLLHRVDGMGTVEEVTARIQRVLDGVTTDPTGTAGA